MSDDNKKKKDDVAVEEQVNPDEAESTEETMDNEEVNEESAETDASQAAEAAESERYMRLMAEFQNFKKRAAKERSDIHAYANEQLMLPLLEVLDNFERALDNDPAADPAKYAEGMELILTSMRDALTKSGLEEIPALGEEFDPTKHNAVMTEESVEYGSGKICRVMQTGYTLNGKVIRAAMVSVAK